MLTTDPSTPSIQGKPANHSPPACLFIGLLALAIITVLGLFSAMARSSAAGFAAVACNLALILGLVLGHRWAYFLVILFSIAGVAVAFTKGASLGLLAILGNAVVVLPVLFSTHYFFPNETTETSDASGPANASSLKEKSYED